MVVSSFFFSSLEVVVYIITESRRACVAKKTNKSQNRYPCGLTINQLLFFKEKVLFPSMVNPTLYLEVAPGYITTAVVVSTGEPTILEKKPRTPVLCSSTMWVPGGRGIDNVLPCLMSPYDFPATCTSNFLPLSGCG